eukprot:TRINITY_DN7325_c0_g1_i1.p1 TRINITY_DN7325_c0_g1~~TRINITY_DN7325_c0_g1_i1.p1  ORF type:complete len:632 (+),score=177.23 TRINITY_DN7325_c0_g1_i1:104-1999(+)
MMRLPLCRPAAGAVAARPLRRFCTQLPAYESLAALPTTNHLGLPRLPIPKLDDTLDRYLKSVQPLVSEDDFAAHRKKVEALRKGSGPQLQRSLEERDAKGENGAFHFESYWSDMYLSARCPNTVHISPFYVFADAPDGDTDPCSRAARFTVAAAEWVLRARKPGGIPADGGDMSYLGQFFGTARIPKEKTDALEHHAESSRHIAVQCAGDFYRVEVIQTDGTAVSAADLRATFAAILDKHDRPIWGSAPSAEQIGLGILTTEDRDVWARHRAALLEGDSSGNNKRSLAGIDSALLVVALDHCKPSFDHGLLGNCRSMLHGVTVPQRTHCNRWYDKMQLVADGAGELGFIFEHSFSDGASWNTTLQDVWRDAHAKPAPALGEALVAEPLEFVLPQSVKDGILAAERKCRKDLIDDVDLETLDFDAYGKRDIKPWKMSPDAVVQQAFQLAYYRLHGESAATYEACAMRPFFRGRTETIRSCTPESAAFVRAVCSGRPRREECRQLLAAATAAQSALAKAAASGQGIDRHLLSLKMEAKTHGVCPGAADLELFDDDIFRRSGTWTISTSNVTMPFIKTFGFGAVCPEGYGFGYQIFDDKIPVHITSFRSGAGTDSSAFRDAFSDALCDIHDVAA